MKSLVFLILFFGINTFAVDVTSFEKLAIQDGGRVKPFDTFARESVQLLTGKESFGGKNATELVISWLFTPDQWNNQHFIQIKHLGLKKDLGIPEAEFYVGPIELASNPHLG